MTRDGYKSVSGLFWAQKKVNIRIYQSKYNR